MTRITLSFTASLKELLEDEKERADGTETGEGQRQIDDIFLDFSEKNRDPVTRNVHILFRYTGQGRFVRETKEALEDVEDVKEDEREDEPEMVKTHLTENDDSENDESEGDYVLLINLVP